MVSGILLKAYKALRSETQKVNGVFERRVPIDSKIPVYIGIELPSDLIRFSFLVTREFKSLFDLGQSEGFELLVSEDADSFGFYRVSVCLKESSYYEIFLVLAADLVGILISAETEKTGFAGFRARMEHWRDFLRLSNSRSLTYEEEIGLFGELVILGKLLLINSSIEILSSWKGPLGKSHDFIRPSISFEIKTSPLKRKSLINISSEFQLDGKNLFLGFVLIDDTVDSPSNKSIPDMIEAILNILSEEGADLFKGLIASTGYKEIESEKYGDRKYAVSSISFYEVSETFPKITPSNIDPQIIDVKYKINVGGLGTYLADSERLIGLMAEVEIGD